MTLVTVASLKQHTGYILCFLQAFYYNSINKTAKTDAYFIYKSSDKNMSSVSDKGDEIVC